MTGPAVNEDDYAAWKRRRQQEDGDYSQFLASHKAPTPPGESFKAATPPASAVPVTSPQSFADLVAEAKRAPVPAPRPMGDYGLPAGRGDPGGDLPIVSDIYHGVMGATARFTQAGMGGVATISNLLGAERLSRAAANQESMAGQIATSEEAAMPTSGPRRLLAQASEMVAGVVPYAVAGAATGGAALPVLLGAEQGIGGVREQLEHSDLSQHDRDLAALGIGSLEGAAWALIPGRVGRLFASEANAITADAERLTVKAAIARAAKQGAETAVTMGAAGAGAAAIEGGGIQLVDPDKDFTFSSLLKRVVQGGVAGAATGGMLGAGEAAAIDVMKAHVAKATETPAPEAMERPAPQAPPPPEAVERPPVAPPAPPEAVERPPLVTPPPAPDAGPIITPAPAPERGPLITPPPEKVAGEPALLPPGGAVSAPVSEAPAAERTTVEPAAPPPLDRTPVAEPESVPVPDKTPPPPESVTPPIEQVSQADPAPGPGRMPEALPPDGVVRVHPSTVEADPERFQFKSGVDPTSGAGAELKSVKKWNPDLAGVIAVWRDPADGRDYVINGHHRLELAKRAGADGIDVRYLDNARVQDASTARATGAMINLAEGRGTAVDVAKWMRDTGASAEDLASNGISMRGDLARRGVALSGLAPDLFDQVATGKLNEAHAVAIGAVTTDPVEQRATVQAVSGSGRRLSASEVGEVARQVRAAGQEHVSQETLFGTETEGKSLFVDRARVAAAIKNRLASDRRLFGFVSKEGRAETLARAGGTSIDVEAAQAIAGESGTAEAYFDQLHTRKGPVADALTDAARKVANGGKLSEVVSATYDPIVSAIRAERDRLPAGARSDSAGEDVPLGGAPPAEAGSAEAGIQLTEERPGESGGGSEVQPAEVAPGSVDENGRTRDSVDPAQDQLFGMGGISRPRGQEDLFGGEGVLDKGGQGALFAHEDLVPEENRGAVGMTEALEKARKVVADPREATLAAGGKPTQAYLEARALLDRDKPIGAEELKGRLDDIRGKPTFTVGMGGIAREVKAEAPAGSSLTKMPETLPEAPGVDAASKPKLSYAKLKDAVLRIMSPRLLSESANRTGLGLRGMRAQVRREVAIAQEQTMELAREAGKLSNRDSVLAIDAIEHGRPTGNAAIDEPMKVLRTILDTYRDRLQRIGKLQNALDSYIGRIWAKDAEDVAASVAGAHGKRPIEGGRSFEKQRTHEFFVDGLNAGLTPISYNWVEVQMLKIAEMSRVLHTHEFLEAEEQQGRGRWVMDMVGKRPPVDADGNPWKQVGDSKDRAFTIYGPPTETIHEAFDANVRAGMLAVAQEMGVQHERNVSVQGHPSWWGAAQRSGTHIESRFGGENFIIMHELGHAIDFQLGLWQKIVRPEGDLEKAIRAEIKGKRDSKSKEIRADNKRIAEQRVQIKQELRALADLRDEGEEPTPGRKAYLRNKYEQIANAMHALILAPERMAEVAPTVKARMEAVLREDPRTAKLLDIKPSVKLEGGTAEIPVAGLRIMGHYYAPDGSAQVINNAVARGIQRFTLYQMLRQPTDAFKQAILGFSGFHYKATAMNGVFSDMALGMEQGASGAPLESTATLAKSVVGPARLAMVGQQVRAEWKNPGSVGGELGRVVDLMTKYGFQSGGRGASSEIWSGERWGQMRRGFEKAFNREVSVLGRAGGGAMGLIESPWALVEKINQPLMGHYVPAMKAGATYEAVADALRRLGEHATPEEQGQRIADVIDEMDKRFGQVIYDNYFTHTLVKDLAQVLFLAPGWTAGTMSLLGSTGKDVVTLPKRVFKRVTTGEPVRMSPSTAFTGAMILGVAMMGAVTHRLLTGKNPEELKDFFFPGDGSVDANGNMNRLDFRSYLTGDYRGYIEHPVKTLINKMSPVLHTASSLVRNETYFGDYAYDPNASLPEKIRQGAKYAAGELGVPLSVRNFMEAKDRNEGTISQGIANFFGVTPAPRDVVRSSAQNMMHDIAMESGHAKLTPDEATRQRERRDAMTALRQGDSEKSGKALQAGTIGMADVKRSLREAVKGETPFAEQFSKLKLPDAEEVYKTATPAQKQQVAQVLLTKRMNAMRARARGEVPR